MTMTMTITIYIARTSRSVASESEAHDHVTTDTLKQEKGVSSFISELSLNNRYYGLLLSEAKSIYLVKYENMI